MSSGDSKYGPGHLIGNASVLRDANPRIRGSARRLDPDGGSSVPYFLGLNGTSLTVNLSGPGVLVINFAVIDGDGYQTAIDTINAVSPANLEASDEDGYLVLKNLNGGGKNFITIQSGTAAPILGYVLDPEPGSSSYAGEVSTSSPGRVQGQNNPQGTALVGGDEDLTSASINRSLVGALQYIGRTALELDVEITAVKEIDVTVQLDGGSGNKYATITDPDIRVPVKNLGFTGAAPDDQELTAVAQLLGENSLEPVVDLLQPTGDRVATIAAILNDDGTDLSFDTGNTFSTWGVLDGASIFGEATVPLKDKHPATAITAIRGDLLEVSGATFQTLGIQPGDTALIEAATNDTPFNHNGEFVVTEILSEELIRVRRKSQFEETFVSSEKPCDVNPETTGSFGTVRVLVGNYVSAKFGLMFVFPTWVNTGAYKLRLMTGQRLSNLTFGDLSRPLSPAVAESMADKIGSISNFSGGPDWADTVPGPATQNPGGITLDAQIIKIITDLVTAGANKIAAAGSGRLVAGSIRAQLDQLDAQWLKIDATETLLGAITFAAAVVLEATAPFTINSGSFTNNAGSYITNALEIVNQSKVLNIGAFPADLTDPLVKPSALNALISGTYSAILQNGNARLYIGTSDRILIALNAKWDGTNWYRVDTGPSDDALLFTFDNLEFKIEKKLGGTGNTWADGAWDAFSYLNPNENALVPKVLPVAWAFGQSNGGGSILDLDDSYGISSIGTSSNTLVVNFSPAMPNTNYAVICTGFDNANSRVLSFQVIDKFVSNFVIQVFDSGIGNNGYLTDTDLGISVLVMGTR